MCSKILEIPSIFCLNWTILGMIVLLIRPKTININPRHAISTKYTYFDSTIDYIKTMHCDIEYDLRLFEVNKNIPQHN